MGPVPAAVLGATVATIVMVLIYVVQCAFSPVVRKGGKKRVRVGRLIFEHVMDAYRTERRTQPVKPERN